jgi:aspartate/methionine/tyrosine aminotransferase
MAIVADEVFAEYELEPGAARAAARVPDRTDVLTFSLGGLSKSVGLPQVKLGWMAMAGPTREVERALTRIEFACDAYLSVSTPVQIAAGELLDHGADVRRQIQSRVAANYRSLFDMASGSPVCHVMHAEGGWSAILRVPAIESEEEMVLTLLDHEGVLIHPGYFFDFPHEAYVIVSLLVREATFVEGVRRLLRYVDSRGGRT